jgi:hypothetical protein
VYKKVDTFNIFSQKFAGLDGEGQDRLVKATLRLLEVQKGLKNDPTSKAKGHQLEKKEAQEGKG